MTIFASTSSINAFGSLDIVMHICRSGVQWPMANSLLLATIFRAGFVVLSYGCKVPAGIFIPSMAVGATFGRMVGIIVKAMYRYVVPLLSTPPFTTLFPSEHTLNGDGLPCANLTCHASRQALTPSLVLQLHSRESYCLVFTYGVDISQAV